MKSKTSANNINSTDKSTNARLYKWSGIAAIITGLVYIIIQIFHPLDVLTSVSTLQWNAVHVISIVMDVLGLLALLGIYMKQANKVGILGFIGYFGLSLFYVLSAAFHFIEAFVFPVLVNEAPKFVEGLQGLVTGAKSEVDLGMIPVVYAVAGISYLLGGFLFGIATFRAAILPRWAGALLAAGASVTILGAVIPHPLDRIMAVPVAVALIWLGWALFTEKSN